MLYAFCALELESTDEYNDFQIQRLSWLTVVAFIRRNGGMTPERVRGVRELSGARDSLQLVEQPFAFTGIWRFADDLVGDFSNTFNPASDDVACLQPHWRVAETSNARGRASEN